MDPEPYNLLAATTIFVCFHVLPTWFSSGTQHTRKVNLRVTQENAFQPDFASCMLVYSRHHDPM